MGTSTVVDQLEAIVASNVPTTKHAATGELLFARSVIDKYGDDYAAAAKDLKLNEWQHTPRQIARKVEKFRATLELAMRNKVSSEGDDDEEE